MRLQRSLFSLVALALVFVACGDDYTGVGAYEGSAELHNATNFGMNTNTRPAVVTLTPAAGDDANAYILGVNENCFVRATLDGTSLTVSQQTCDFSTARADDSWNYEGTGTLDEGQMRLKLELSGTFTRTYTDNSGTPALMGNHKFTFDGSQL